MVDLDAGWTAAGPAPGVSGAVHAVGGGVSNLGDRH